MQEILRLERISECFPGVKALQDVSMTIYQGEIHALIGENGAGKSTLMKIVAGLYTPDAGEVMLKGKSVTIHNSRDSIRLGVSMIHQELMPIPDMAVAENIFLGREPVTPGMKLFDRKALYRMTTELFEQMDIAINPKLSMRKLNVAETQLVEIAKAVSYNADILIMDEPTSAISDREVAKLFTLIRLLKQKGVSIVYISHKLKEIFEVSDRITVLRDGEHIATEPIVSMTEEKLIAMMVGRELSSMFPRQEKTIGEVVLEVEGLTRDGEFEDVGFAVRQGEVLGIAGLMGAGRTEVVETLFGLRDADSGSICVQGKRKALSCPAVAIESGISLIPEDRKGRGLNLKASVKDNITLASLGKFCTVGFVNRLHETRQVDEQIQALNIKTPSKHQSVNSLSGRNQQKVVISKWLLTDSEVLIMDEPTRGIDVGAKAEIYALIGSLAAQGKAVIMISSELEEIIGMSDRVLVLHEGKITGEFRRGEFTQEQIMACATGHLTQEGRAC